MILGEIYSSNHLNWIPKSAKRFLGIKFFTSEDIGTYKGLSFQLSCYKCNKCNKIIINLDENESV